MRTVWLFGHQLSTRWQILSELDQQCDRILLIEASSRGQWRMYHKQKLIFVYSAMRHFAKHLIDLGYQVDYRYAETFAQGVQAHYDSYAPQQLILHLPTEWTMRSQVLQWKNRFKQDLREDQFEIIVRTEDELFLVAEHEWSQYLPTNKKWNLEQIYRKLRVRYNILMDGNQPIGGQWNYDTDNRNGPNKHMKFVSPMLFDEDGIVQQVIAEVETNFPHHPGLSKPFVWPVTYQQAEAAFEHFLAYRLATFGTYQDAMVSDDPFMSHSLIASALNFGLLHPLDVIRRVEACYHNGQVPLSAAEGFIRQILGWREYVRGVYLSQMPNYAQVNAWHHHRALPEFYWTGKTQMACIKHAVDAVNQFAYSHHIQRLMVLCNFANLAQISPQAVSDWFNEMYIDALDWVVLPNVLGMGLYADGGLMSSKPYISTGQYIDRMSDSCKSCTYRMDVKIGENACPFHALYWAMIDRHQASWQKNPRMSMMVNLWRKMGSTNQQAIRDQADQILQKCDLGLL